LWSPLWEAFSQPHQLNSRSEMLFLHLVGLIGLKFIHMDIHTYLGGIDYRIIFYCSPLLISIIKVLALNSDMHNVCHQIKYSNLFIPILSERRGYIHSVFFFVCMPPMRVHYGIFFIPQFFKNIVRLLRPNKSTINY
jgi:hypothetical protein